jgi:Domain of unknown function (DUF4186)
MTLSSSDGAGASDTRPNPVFVEIDEAEKAVIIESRDPGGEPIRKRLKLSCSASRCGDNLHCFIKSRKMAIHGACRECGRDDLVDWERVRKRNIEDVPFVFEELEKEMVRHIYWHVPFDQHAVNKARRKGRAKIYSGIAARIHTAVGAAHHPAEGKQTPWAGDAYFYAQHATGSCCRRCVEYWHGIKTDAPLTEDEESYLVALAHQFLYRRLPEQIPELTEEGEKVAPIRPQRSNSDGS